MKWTKQYWYLLVVGFAFWFIIGLGYVLPWRWVGMIIDPATGLSEVGYRTLWDWLGLLVVPAVLAFGAIYLSKRSAEVERGIAKDKQQQAFLDAYFDRMTNLILKEELKDSKREDDPVRIIARTHTLSVLRNLDGKRKGQVIRFLFESNLINAHPIINLANAELREADLILVPLRDLYGVGRWTSSLVAKFVTKDIDKYPFGRKSWSVDLSGAVFKNADLRKAAFFLTDLSNANLIEADLERANLPLARLQNADFTGANLKDADLRKANLTDAIVKDEQLQSAKSLEGAIMPNGKEYHDGYFLSKQ